MSGFTGAGRRTHRRRCVAAWRTVRELPAEIAVSNTRLRDHARAVRRPWPYFAGGVGLLGGVRVTHHGTRRHAGAQRPERWMRWCRALARRDETDERIAGAGRRPAPTDAGFTGARARERGVRCRCTRLHVHATRVLMSVRG